MGSACTCIKDANQNEVEQLSSSHINIKTVVRIQAAIRMFLARKQLQQLKRQKFQGMNQNNKKGGHYLNFSEDIVSGNHNKLVLVNSLQ